MSVRFGATWAISRALLLMIESYIWSNCQTFAGLFASVAGVLSVADAALPSRSTITC